MRVLTSIAVLALLAAGPALSQSKDDPRNFMSSLDGSITVATAEDAQSLGPAAVAPFSIAGIDSWDLQGDADNIVMNFDIGAGNQVTGISFDVGIASVGASWCSEADVFFTDSGLTTGVILTPGVAETNPCDLDFTSGGVDDVTMFNVIAGADGMLRIEFAESFDDVADAVDANLRDAAAPTITPGFGLVCTDQAACDAAFGGGPLLPPPPAVPALSLFGLLALGLLLVTGTVLVMRRKA